jgi:aconitate hydratase
MRDALATLETSDGAVCLYSIEWLREQGVADLQRLPHTVKILLENLLRRAGTSGVTEEDVLALAQWPGGPPGNLSFMPTRILMQDFTGVPAVVDLAGMRAAVVRAGGDPPWVDPQVPVDLVVDHSVQVDRFGDRGAYAANIDWEYRRNGERYSLLRWAQQAFGALRVVPPGMGICHQVNLEYLASVVRVVNGLAVPDTLVGTDSHTTMVNGLGVLGWGVGGIEAEAAMLGQPTFLPWPTVIGVRISGALPSGVTATDLVLTLTEGLRAHGVVGSFVEFFGAGLSTLEVADRATLSNMCPEYGATAALFPVDSRTLQYLRETGRGRHVELVERYTKEQGLFRTDQDPDPAFSEVLGVELSSVEPSLAGPKRPQDRVSLSRVWGSFVAAFRDRAEPDPDPAEVERFDTEGDTSQSGADPHQNTPESGRTPRQDGRGLRDGSVVIAAITSCTNTSNPIVMVSEGLLARNAVNSGLTTRPWVKTSLAPGSRVVTGYLETAGLMPYLEKLGFALVGYGCTTCIGNSGPLLEEVAREVEKMDLTVVAILSGNRNFEGRIHPQVRASYLASPPLCVAYALAGRIDLDLSRDALGAGADGQPVYLRDIWPAAEDVRAVVDAAVTAEEFEREYGHIFEGDERWRELSAPFGALYDWDPQSTYVREPPFFDGIDRPPTAPADIVDARVLVLLGDTVTTDHISPAGSITVDSPAGQYLIEAGVQPLEFNSYGSRRGNHEVMLRGTFGNPRLRNALTPDLEGQWTMHFPTGDRTTIYDAAMRYREEGVPLVVVAGKEYGSGSSRDWAAKGTALLGVRAVLAESFERIHRSNLVALGVLPLQFRPGESAALLGLRGAETLSVRRLADGIHPGGELVVEARREDGSVIRFHAKVRIDVPVEVDYYRHGGVLPLMARQLLHPGAPVVLADNLIEG